MPVPKKYRFIHLVIAVCSHKIQTATHSHPPFGRLPLFLPKTAKSTPDCITTILLSPFIPPNRFHYLVPPPVPPPVTLYFRGNWLSQGREKKKTNNNSFWVGQVVPAPRKCFSVPPSHRRAWPRAKDGVWAGSPQEEKSVGTEVSGPHHT